MRSDSRLLEFEIDTPAGIRPLIVQRAHLSMLDSGAPMDLLIMGTYALRRDQGVCIPAGRATAQVPEIRIIHLFEIDREMAARAAEALESPPDHEFRSISKLPGLAVLVETERTAH